MLSAAAITAVRHPSSIEVETAALVKRFRDAYTRITAPDTMHEQLRSAFGIPALDRDSCKSALYGSLREMDSVVVLEKATRIASRRPADPPLESLEIAAGRSLGGNDVEFGCPFISRAEALAWRGIIRSTVTDFNQPWGCTILFERKGKLVIEKLGIFEIADERIFSGVKCGPNGRTVEPVSLQTARQRCGEASAFEIERIRSHLWINCDHRWEGEARTWVLPHLSADYEQAFYEIPECRRDVNFYNLDQSFPGRKFDFIVGRHIHNLREEQVEALRLQVAARLKPGGWACVQADGWKHGTHLIEIGERMSTPDDARRFAL